MSHSLTSSNKGFHQVMEQDFQEAALFHMPNMQFSRSITSICLKIGDLKPKCGFA
jgi:hypothetical protein